MKCAIVSGSHRSNSQSEKVANYLKAKIHELDPSSESMVISLAGNPLPFWDEEAWENSAKWQTSFGPISTQFKGCDAVILVVPEWGGMVPPALKNLLLLCSTELAHKPALIVSVTAGPSGSYPISELRMSGYKNTHLCYLPSHLIIRDVKSVLNGDVVDTGRGEDKLRERIDYSLNLLSVYAEGFKHMREITKIDLNRYPYGM